MYTVSGKTDIDALVAEFVPLVKRIAHHMMARLPANVNVEDIVQTGMMGLLDAAQRFDATQGALFETYASQRIRGEILDSLRSADWMPRELRKNSRKIEQAVRALEHRFGRAPLEQEIASELKLSLADYQQMLFESKGCQLIYYEDYESSDDEHYLDRHVVGEDEDPLSQLMDEGFRAALVAAIGHLPEREKMVMALYYDEELNFKEIGEVLGVGESRVCQIHSQAVARLRVKLRGSF